MDIMKEYSRWCELATEDNDIVNELNSLKKENSDKEIEERFYRNLEFGTGGLRGILGAGTNRMNIYTIRKATQGLANYLLQTSKSDLSVAIAYDSRIKSDVFAKEASKVLASNGIKVYLYPQLMPTPALSFAVRHLKCDAGICVTASHNPAKYNGYKVYGNDGCQITLEMAEKVLSCIEKVDPFNSVKVSDYDTAIKNGDIELISREVVDEYLQNVLNCRVTNVPLDNLKLVYTPLNGAGLMCVTEILEKIGIKDVTIVEEQRNPDGNFPTCPYPNPEIREALQKGLELSEKVNADMLLATDPDCDRVGIAVKHNGRYELLSGNEVGALLLDFIIKQRTMNKTLPKNPVAVKTIVSTELATSIAKKNNVELRNVLTGFKFIGEQIAQLEKDGEADRYILGFEESYGYLSSGYVRDKDAVNASMLICEMAGYYTSQGKTLIDVLNELYEEHGYYVNDLDTFTYEGAQGSVQMKNIMSSLRNNPPKLIGNLNVVGVMDYIASKGVIDGKEVTTDLPVSDILEFYLEGNCKLIIRPSGTEPKIKLYYFSTAQTLDKAKQIIKTLSDDCKNLLK